MILRAAHALPDQVVEMFKEDFETNDIWQHFQAVEEGRVYDLTYEYFGMSANFNYPQALEELQLCCIRKTRNLHSKEGMFWKIIKK